MISLGQLASMRGQIARASEIATTLWSSGFGWLVAAVGLESCVQARCRLHCAIEFEQCPHHVHMDEPLPIRARLVLERLGPTFVKVGQMLALRPDYVPLAYAEALRELHTNVEPFPAEQAARIVEAELAAPLARLFAEWEPTPFAAASLSQVHRATLPDGTLVAVKVQRPGIAQQIERDLALLAFLARRLERRRREALAFRPTAAVAEFAAYTRRELDFRREARTAQRVSEFFADDPQVVIPRIDWTRTTSRVLTAQLIEGLPPAPAADLAARGIDPDAVLGAGAHAMFRQIFELGLFHADPHPGNMLILPDGRVGFLDFGMFGKLTSLQRRRMALVFWSLHDGDYDNVAAQLLRISTTSPNADKQGFAEAVSELVEEWYGANSTTYSIARLLLRQLALGANYGIVFPRELMLLARALVLTESTAQIIEPDLTISDYAGPYLPELERQLLSPGSLQQSLHDHRYDYLDLALSLPELLPTLTMATQSPVQRGADAPAPKRAGIAIAGGLLTGAALMRAWQYAHRFNADRDC